MYNCTPPPITVAGRDLAEFRAKMQSWPEIAACDVDTGIFQGVGRNTMHLLQQRRGARSFTCTIDFWGDTPLEWAANISAFSALVSTGAVEIDIGDGYLYRAVLLEESAPVVVGEVVATVEYKFQVVRHWPQQTIRLTTSATEDTVIVCQSNYPITDCKIYLPYIGNASGLDGFRLMINNVAWSYGEEPTAPVTLDGINKIYAMGGTTISTALVWSDFPFLLPGQNTISLWEETASGEGGRIAAVMEITYVPSFL